MCIDTHIIWQYDAICECVDQEWNSVSKFIKEGLCVSVCTNVFFFHNFMVYHHGYKNWWISSMDYTQTPKSLQCLRLTAIPNLNARHDPCPGTDLAKPLSPLETLRLTSYHGSISNGFFSLTHNGTPVSYSPFCQELLRAHLRPAL